MNVSRRLSEMAITGRFNPITGEPFVPVGISPLGRMIWPVLGGSGEEDPEDEEDPKDEADDDDPEGSEKSKEESGKSGDAQAKIADLEEEKDRHYKWRKQAETERDELKKRLEAIENKDTPELDVLKKETESQKVEIDVLKDSLREARLENAFFVDNTYQWHNPSRALKLLDMTGIDIDSDGKVSGLKKALDDLAKSDPYLVKGKENDKKEPEGKGKTGEQPQTKPKAQEAAAAQLKTLQDKYPGLRR